MLKLYFLIITIHYSYQNSNITGRPYYFRMGKTRNEFRVNNRVYFLNHNITDYDFTHKRIDNIHLQKENPNNNVSKLRCFKFSIVIIFLYYNFSIIQPILLMKNGILTTKILLKQSSLCSSINFMKKRLLTSKPQVESSST